MWNEQPLQHSFPALLNLSKIIEYESRNGKRPIPTGLSDHNILINHCISISTWVAFRMVKNKHVRIKPFFCQVTAFPQVLCYSKEKITFIFCSFLCVAGSPAFPLEPPNMYHSQQSQRTAASHRTTEQHRAHPFRDGCRDQTERQKSLLCSSPAFPRLNMTSYTQLTVLS